MAGAPAIEQRDIEGIPEREVSQGGADRPAAVELPDEVSVREALGQRDEL